MTQCPDCGKEQTDEALACAGCGALIWRERLQELYNQSRQEEQAGNYQSALLALSECVRLLPPGTRQSVHIQSEIQRVSYLYSSQPPAIDQSSLEAPDPEGLQQARGPGMILAIIRSMLRGLTRPKTAISLAVWIACLTFLMNWQQALLFGVLIYMHEMGHLVAIQYYGYRFSWPFFVPFLGAFVLQGKASEDRSESMVIALAGPVAGFLGSLAVMALPLPPQLMRIAEINILINLLNLMPVWLLDGARVSKQLSRMQHGILVLVLAAGCVWLRNGHLFLMAATWLVGMCVAWNTTARSNEASRLGERRVQVLTAFTAALIIVQCLLVPRL